MDIDRFFTTVLSQNAEEIRKYFHKDDIIKWHCTNELFTLWRRKMKIGKQIM